MNFLASPRPAGSADGACWVLTERDQIRAREFNAGRPLFNRTRGLRTAFAKKVGGKG